MNCLLEMYGATAFPPPLWGRDREGGIAGAEFTNTPHPNPPPQGGREHARRVEEQSIDGRRTNREATP